jgi:hypothetical protein
MVTRTLPGFIYCFIAIALTWGAEAIKGKVFPEEKLSPLVNCLAENLNHAKFDSRKADQTFFRVKYWYGIFPPEKDPSLDALYLLILHKDPKEATLYVIYPENKNGKDNYEVGNVGKFYKENGRFELSEALGGLATYKYLQKIVDAISNKPEIMVPKAKDRSNDCSCRAW